jgi:hypothetical protein
VTAGHKSSRESADAAGWAENGYPRCDKEYPPAPWWELLDKREKPKWDSFSWLTVRALFESINDLFAKFRPEIVDERRARWVALQRAAGAAVDDFVISPPPPEAVAEPNARGFLLVGDTGEQDASQYAVAPYLTNAATQQGPDGKPHSPEFLLIVSDVIYPAGDINEYVNGFYIPYRDFKRPIYALPGNHDWYDGLDGFMYHFCGAEPLALEGFRSTEVRPATRLANLLWRRSGAPERERLSRWRDSRDCGRNAAKAVQPAPYFALDLGDLMLVNIDTGVTGTIDDEQGRWLLRVSKIRKQKILLTGKPIYVDGAYHPGKISWKPSRREYEEDGWPPYKTVDDVVRHEPFGYLAAIGGDVHNYQRYPIWLENQERRIYYLVSGGGGAYLSPTHRIGPSPEEPKAEDDWPKGLKMPLDEDVPDPERRAELASTVRGWEDEKVATTFHCYPQRGDSLAYFARRAGPRMFNMVQTAAAAFVAAAALLLFADPLEHAGGMSLAVAYVPIVATALLLAWPGKWFNLKRWLGIHLDAEPEPWQPTPIHYPLGAVAFALLLLFAVCALGAEQVHGGELLSDPRFWAMTAVALAVPALLIGAILWAHDLHGSTPALLPLLAVVGAFATAIPILHPFGDFLGAPAWFTIALFVLAFMAVGMLGFGALRAYGGDRGDDDDANGSVGLRRILCCVLYELLTVAGPALLAYALGKRTDAGGVPWLAAALAACGLWPLVLSSRAFGAETYEASRRPGWKGRLEDLETGAQFLSTVAWITSAAILLHAIGDGWIAMAAIGAVAVLAILLAFGAMFLLGFETVLKRFKPAIAIGAVLLVAPALPLPAPIPALSFLAAAVALLAVAYLNVKALRRGRLNANAALWRITELLNEDGEEQVPDDTRPSQADDDEALFHLLYPYRWDPSHAQGTQRTGTLAQTLAKLLAELGDSDEPPFFKNLLRVDVRERKPSSSDGDATARAERELTIRCFGVTGFAKEEAEPPVEDEIHIPFHSPTKFEDMYPLDKGPEPVAGDDRGEARDQREAEVEPDEVGVTGVGKAV